MNRCRICCQPLEHEVAYHASCCRGLFGQPSPPDLPFTSDELNGLAEKIIRRSISVSGVQPKLSVHLEKQGKDKNTRLTLVGLEGGYILKPPAEAYPEMPELEHLVMRMALLFGIQTAPCGLIPLSSGEFCYITKRLDRIGKKSLHMEDMCQITDNLTEQKYRGGSMEKVAKALRKHCTNTGLDALRLLELALFCFLTGNADMHLKNFSLLHQPEGNITLSPAYDLLPTKLLIPKDTEESALPLNGKKNRLQWKDFEYWADHSLQLNKRQVMNVRARFAKAMPSVLAFIPMGFAGKNNQKKLTELLKSRAERIGI